MKAIELTGIQWESEIKTAKFAVLPVASLEYHGPCAPIGTDTILAEHFTTILEKRSDCVVYPTIVYSTCPAKTKGYIPTISIRPEIMIGYIIDVLKGIQSAGFSKVLVLNAHDGNMGMIRTAAETMDGDFKTLCINWWQLLTESQTEEFFTNGGRGHGGPYELSAVWAALNKKEIQGDETYDLPVLKFQSPHVHIESKPYYFKGYGGMIQEANNLAGAKILNIAAKALENVINQWLLYSDKNSEKEG